MQVRASLSDSFNFPFSSLLAIWEDYISTLRQPQPDGNKRFQWSHRKYYLQHQISATHQMILAVHELSIFLSFTGAAMLREAEI